MSNEMIYPLTDAEDSIEDLATMHSFGMSTEAALYHLADSMPHYSDEAYEEESMSHWLDQLNEMAEGNNPFGHEPLDCHDIYCANCGEWIGDLPVEDPSLPYFCDAECKLEFANTSPLA